MISETNHLSDENITAEEYFRVDVQYVICKRMRQLGLRPEELAPKLQISVEDFMQIFTDEYEMPIRLLGRICNHLGLKVEFKHE